MKKSPAKLHNRATEPVRSCPKAQGRRESRKSKSRVANACNFLNALKALSIEKSLVKAPAAPNHPGASIDIMRPREGNESLSFTMIRVGMENTKAAEFTPLPWKCPLWLGCHGGTLMPVDIV